MIGSRYSRESGQALLIVVMVVAVVLTVVLTVTFTSRTDTQLTALEQESEKAQAAAEAGIEAALRQNRSIADLREVGALGQTIQAGQVTISGAQGDTFATPVVQRGEAYTFYLAPYTPGTPPSFGPSQRADVTLCFGQGSQPTLDIALLKGSSTVLRYVVDPANRLGGSGKLALTNGCAQIPQGDIGTDSRLLLVRTLFTPASLTLSQRGLPPQGRYIDSEATSQTGVTKKVRLLQSYPQIPAEFFSTSF